MANLGDNPAGETTGTAGTDEWGESATTGQNPTTSAGTDGASTSATTGSGPKFDLLRLDVGGGGGPPPHEDCPNPLQGTDVTGTGPLGEFNGKWGYFGGYNGDFDWFHIVLFDETADLEAEEEYAWDSWGFIDQGPALVVYPNFSKDDIPMVGAADAEHFDGDYNSYAMVSVSIENIEMVDSPEGYWFMTGHIAPWPDEENADHPLAGPFAAAYCAAFDENIIAE